MTKELLVSHTSGTTVYATIRLPINRNHGTTGNGRSGNIGYWWNVALVTHETFIPANFANYAIALTELGTTGLFEGDIPTSLNPEKALEVIYWERAGAAALMGDTKITGSNFEFLDEWVAVSTLRV